MSEQSPTWPEVIEWIMEKKGWTGRQLALEMGINESTVSHWRCEEQRPSGPARVMLRRLVAEIKKKAIDDARAEKREAKRRERS